ncbi:hypothetical protein BURPS1710b_A2035 [Burkholderia pseudomallei 1710b]|uniref:Uncharacterized protein n=1 Tax=Burkholderia pseudomallei (strain 1710b) TaxID=320372 RepID=Q3JGW7_BURP1|nr:hypothetical protein BURPS1710b_A2035 [Burkholderia pseudomallei 1710b]
MLALRRIDRRTRVGHHRLAPAPQLRAEAPARSRARDHHLRAGLHDAAANRFVKRERHRGRHEARAIGQANHVLIRREAETLRPCAHENLRRLMEHHRVDIVRAQAGLAQQALDDVGNRLGHEARDLLLRLGLQREIRAEALGLALRVVAIRRGLRVAPLHRRESVVRRVAAVDGVQPVGAMRIVRVGDEHGGRRAVAERRRRFARVIDDRRHPLGRAHERALHAPLLDQVRRELHLQHEARAFHLDVGVERAARAEPLAQRARQPRREAPRAVGGGDERRRDVEQHEIELGRVDARARERLARGALGHRELGFARVRIDHVARLDTPELPPLGRDRLDFVERGIVVAQQARRQIARETGHANVVGHQTSIAMHAMRGLNASSVSAATTCASPRTPAAAPPPARAASHAGSWNAAGTPASPLITSTRGSPAKPASSSSQPRSHDSRNSSDIGASTLLRTSPTTSRIAAPALRGTRRKLPAAGSKPPSKRATAPVSCACRAPTPASVARLGASRSA